MATENEEKSKPEQVELPNAEPGVKVRLDEDEDGDGADGREEEDRGREDSTDKPDQAAQARDPKTGQWGKKHRQRGQDHRDQRRWETERAEYDRRFRMMQEDYDRRFSQMRQELERNRTPADRSDPFAAKLADLDKQLDQELSLIESKPDHGYGRYRQLQDQRNEVIAQRVWQRQEAQREQNRPPQSPYAARSPIISAEFPWTDDPRFSELTRKAMAYRNNLIHVEGRPDTLDTDREALQTIMSRFGADFGLRPPPAPAAQRTRDLYAAPASRGVPQRNGRPREVELPAELVRGTGLNAERLARAVNAAYNDET